MTRPASRHRGRLRPTLERLDDRTLLTVAVQIDYSLDTRNFFNTQAKRDLLQVAADTVASRLSDALDAIVPSGTDTWTATTDNPATGASVSFNNLTIPANTVLVYAGARPLAGAELGQGGYGASNATGAAAWLNSVTNRGQLGALASPPTDFGPWGGTVTFDSTANWYFGVNGSGLGAAQNDFLSVALHEMEHLFGFGTAPSWNAQVQAGHFLGVNARVEYNANTIGLPPVSVDGGHWAQGTRDRGFEVSMDPSVLVGTRKLITPLDYAALADIGWDFDPDPDATLATAQMPAELNINGQNLAAVVPGPLTLANGTDVDMYQVTIDLPRTITFTSSANAYLRLFTASGDELARTGSTAGTMVVAFPAAGTYFLGVSAVGNSIYSPTTPFLQTLAGPAGAYTLSFAEGGTAGGGTNNTRADLAVTISAPTSVPLGEALTYTVTVTNNGPDAATGVLLSASFPDGSTLISDDPTAGTARVSGNVIRNGVGTLGTGGSATLTVQVKPGAAGAADISASATTTTTDPAVANNAASARVTVTLPGQTPPPPGGDTTPPVVVSARIVTVGKGARAVRRIVLGFSETVDPTTAINPGIFALTRPGKARRGRPAPRIAVGIKAVDYDAGTNRLTITPAFKGVPPKGLRLRVSASLPGGIHDLAGNALDGDRNGTPGGDAVLKLS